MFLRRYFQAYSDNLRLNDFYFFFVCPFSAHPLLRTLLTIQNFLRKACPFKVVVALVVQTKEEIICQLPAPFIVSTVYPCKSKTTGELLCVLALHT